MALGHRDNKDVPIKKAPIKVFINVDFAFTKLNKIVEAFNKELKRSHPDIDLNSPAAHYRWKISEEYEQVNELLDVIRRVRKAENRKKHDVKR